MLVMPSGIVILFNFLYPWKEFLPKYFKLLGTSISIIELFKNDLGYEHVYAPDLERDDYAVRNPLYEDILIDSLYRLNRNLPEDAISDALYKLKNFENGELVQKNMVFMDYLQNGIPGRYF